MNKIYFIILFIVFGSILNAQTMQSEEAKADCIILLDENSIICKYSHERIDKQREVKFEWIEPDGNVSRVRNMIVPANHGSVYDYRYIKGRTQGTWTFKVTDNMEQIKANFIIE